MMAVIHYLIYFILVFISFFTITYYYEVPKALIFLAVVMYLLLPIVAPFIRSIKWLSESSLIKKDFKPKDLSLIGVIVFIMTLFIHMLLVGGQNNYIPVAQTDNIEQANKIQNVLLDHYSPIRISRHGMRYDIEIGYNKKFLEYAPVILADSDVINDNTRIVIGVDYDDLHTLEERIEMRLAKLILHIEGVYKATVDLDLHLNTKFPEDREPVKAKVIVETDKGFIQERIEKTIKTLMLASIFDLEEKNLEIEIKTDDCGGQYCYSEYYGIAKKLYVEQKYEEALAMLEKGEKVLPHKHVLSITQLKDLINVNKQIAKSPNNYKLYIKRGDIKNIYELAVFTTTPQGITSDYNGAIKDYTKALELNPKAYEVYARRGNAYEDACSQKDVGYQCEQSEEYTEKAIADYKKAIEYPSISDVDFRYDKDHLCEKVGNYYFSKKDYSSAIEYYAKISDTMLFPNKDEILNLPKPDKTLALFNPRKAKLENYLPFRIVECYKQLKQYDKAKELCEKILANTDDKDYIKHTKKILKTIK